MESFTGFFKGNTNIDKPLMVFDWCKAARLIKNFNAHSALAGLCNDWKWTGGEILNDGKPIDKNETYVYLASTWAVPELEMLWTRPYKKEDYINSWIVKYGEKLVVEANLDQRFIYRARVDCYITHPEREEWNSHTYWPKEALEILMA